MRAGGTSSPPTSSCSPSTARSCGTPRARNGVQLRFEGAVAGVVPVIRVLQESLAGATIDRVHGIVNGTTNFILTEMARTGMTFDAGARRGAAARLRRGRPVRGRRRPRRRGQDGDPRPAGVRHARSTSTRSATRGSSTSSPTTSSTRASSGCGLKLIGTAERIGDGLSVRVHPGVPVSAAIRWPRSSGPFNAVTVESEAITEITMSGPGAGGPQTAERGARRRDQRDDPARLDAADDRACSRSSRTSSRRSTCTSRSPTSRACWPRSPRCWPHQDVSVKSVVQKGLGDQARLVMVVHPVLESRFSAAMDRDRRARRAAGAAAGDPGARGGVRLSRIASAIERHSGADTR